MPGAWRRIYTAAALYALLQVVLFTYTLPALLGL